MTTIKPEIFISEKKNIFRHKSKFSVLEESFLDFKIYINRCRRAKVLPNKDDAILAIQKTFLMIFKTNPSEVKLMDGLLPIITGRGLSIADAKAVITNANSCPDSSRVLFESQRRNIFLSTKSGSNFIINNAGIDITAKTILSKYESYAASCLHNVSGTN